MLLTEPLVLYYNEVVEHLEYLSEIHEIQIPFPPVEQVERFFEESIDPKAVAVEWVQYLSEQKPVS